MLTTNIKGSISKMITLFYRPHHHLVEDEIAIKIYAMMLALCFPPVDDKIALILDVIIWVDDNIDVINWLPLDYCTLSFTSCAIT
jgi:hypothetical protein